MTRSTEKRGIKMRRLCVLLLLLALVFVGCSARFTSSEEGYLDGKTGVAYHPLSEAYEAITGGDEVGAWESKIDDETLTFLEIPDADPLRFLTDEKGNVYCSDEAAPDASQWRVNKIHVCDESAISVAVATITDADTIAQIRTLWHEGEVDELPYSGFLLSRELKMPSEDCPGIYYCVLYYVYEDGSAYFYDRFERRAVLVSEDLVKKIPLT